MIDQPSSTQKDKEPDALEAFGQFIASVPRKRSRETQQQVNQPSGPTPFERYGKTGYVGCGCWERPD